MPLRSVRARSLLAALIVVAAFYLLALHAGSARAASGTISGTAFQDMNRNGVQDPGEAPLASQGIQLLDATGQSQVAYTATDANGRYSFTGLPDGTYVVKYGFSEWLSVRHDWVPSTTGSIYPQRSVTLSGSAIADFGWRPIVRSTSYSAPITTYTGANGLKVNSYDDVVAANDIYDDLMRGSLIGAEAPYVTVAFDFTNNTDMTSISVSGSTGNWSNFRAVPEMAYVAWLDGGDQMLFHEYGHAWSLYNAYIVQQDDTLTAYLKARGVYGDPRLGSSHAWDPREMIAEDYRQLFGTLNAQTLTQENSDLPAAGSVPGLRDFLATTYTQPPAPSPSPSSSPSTSPTPAPTPALSVSGLAMSPAPVKTGGTASFSLSAPATVTLVVRDAKGNLVRTLLSSVPEQAGAITASWDRKNAASQRVKSGTYTLVVDAADASGSHVTASAAFSVS
jgi:hypothetical protein